MYEEHAYVVTDGAGVCTYATAAALQVLGIDAASLAQLRVDDLSRPSLAADAFRQQVHASVCCIGRWLTGEVDLSRADGSNVVVPFALLRHQTGEVIVRFDTDPADDAGPHGRVRDVLEAWRRQEQQASSTPAGSPEHLLAEAEVDRLSAEYQRLADERARQIANER